MDDVREWQSRPLEDVYPVLFLDCMMVKIRDGGTVQRRACYLALAIRMDGERDVLGMRDFGGSPRTWSATMPRGTALLRP
jgi:putative transposase